MAKAKMERIFMKNKPFLLTIFLVFFLMGMVFAQEEDGDFFNKQGIEYYNMGNYDKAIEAFVKAKDMFEKTVGKAHDDYGVAVNNLGVLYYSIGDYSRAEQYYLEALAIKERAEGKNNPSYADSLNNLAALYNYMGDINKSEQYYLESKAIRERVQGKDHPSYAESLHNLGYLYVDMGDYKKAEQYFLESKAIREKVLGKDHPVYAVTLCNLGNLYVTLGDYKKAESYLLEAKAVQEKVLGKDHPDYSVTLNNLGDLYRAMGDSKKAEPYILEALGINERVLGKNHPGYATLLINMGMLYYTKADHKKAERYFLESKAIWEKVMGKDHPYYALSLDFLSINYLSNKKYDQAVKSKTEANLLMVKNINRNFAFLSEQQRNFYWNANSNSFELTYSFSHFKPVPANNILSYDNALFSKGLLLRTTNAVRDAIYSSGDKKLIDQYEELGRLRQQIGALQQSGDKDEYVKSLETQADALDKSLTQASAVFKEFQADLNLDWKDVQKSLLEKEAAIEFVSFRLFDKGWSKKTMYAALVLKPGMKAPVWIPLCEENVLAGFFEKTKGKNPLEQTQILYDEYGNDLYKTIWQPLEKTLKGVTVIYYSPSGLLHKIAFNALPVTGNTRLMDKYDLHLVSSTREVVSRKNKKSEAPRTAVVYGGIFYDANESSMKQAARGYKAPATQTRGLSLGSATELAWGYLAATVPESEEIRGLFTQNKTTAELFSGNNGNEESFKALSGKKIAVIHLATHGFFIEDIEKNYEDRERLERLGGQKALENPLLRSGLILAGANNSWTGKPVAGVEDGILFADEVARMNLLGTDLVVMSACETGLGTVNNGEGVFGLQRAFKLAGVNTLIMSLWSVSDDATSILMRVFYQAWLSGKSKQDALKEAQKTLRGMPQYASPFYWAAFVMMD